LSGDYADDNGFTTELLGKVGIDISGKEWLKKLVPYLLVLIPGLMSVYMSIKDIAFFGNVVGMNAMILMAGGVIGISVWQAVKRMFGLLAPADSATADAVTPTEADGAVIADA
jgi:hypothetical protein